MNRTPRPWMIIASLLALFALGGATGAFVQSTITHSMVLARATSGEWATQELEIYRQRLALTDAQVETLRPAFAATNEKLKQLHTETRQRIGEMLKENSSVVRAQLSPDQQRRLDALIQERKARLSPK